MKHTNPAQVTKRSIPKNTVGSAGKASVKK